MGARGPVPNRSDDLNRPRERKGSDVQPITKGTSRPATIPDADPTWHPIALMLWNACLESGQSDFYESSDYAMLYSLCEDLSMYKSPITAKDGTQYDKRSGQMLQTIYSAMESLLVTEGARRRVRIELTNAEDKVDEAAEAVLDDYDRGLYLVS